MKGIFKVLFAVLGVLYPIFVFTFLVVLHVPSRVFSLFIILTGMAYMLYITGSKDIKGNIKLIVSSLLLLSSGMICMLTGSVLFIKLYPVAMNLVFLFTFAVTLFEPPSFCFRFALLADKSIKGSLACNQIQNYCRNLTAVWCLFFIINGTIAFITVISNNELLWSVYNGGISYLLIGLLSLIEFIIRKVLKKHMRSPVPLSNFNSTSHDYDMVFCYEGKWSDSKYLTWKDFLTDTAKLRMFIQSQDHDTFILHCDDYYHFTCTLTALLQCKKHVLLASSTLPSYIAELKSNREAMYLSDQPFTTGAWNIQDILLNNQDNSLDIHNTPQIDADRAFITLFTSGSTGKPKEITHTLSELEADNAFIISNWGDKLADRKVFGTVSQHHMFGLLYTVLLPFTCAIPFERRRIEIPEQIEEMDDASYLMITVPAFLKRANTYADTKSFSIKEPFIIVSGGVLLPKTASDTEKKFGFWPLEIYGSTETCGIGWRQSKQKLEWTAYHNTTLSVNTDGTLCVKNLSISDKNGFKTADIVTVNDDGSFYLAGRADSIVKIEDKRISITEIENRLIQTGLIEDICIIPMSDRRQYLAAAVVLSNEGVLKFNGDDKYKINRFFHDYLMEYFDNVVLPKKWRYLDSIPCDIQGKKKKLEIQKLFITDSIHGIKLSDVISKTEDSVSIKLNISGTSDYFDGHFPDFKLLPAVAQIDIACHAAHKYLGTSMLVTDLKRLKFSDKIRPDSILMLSLTVNQSAITFKYTDLKGENTFSAGTFTYQKDN